MNQILFIILAGKATRLGGAGSNTETCPGGGKGASRFWKLDVCLSFDGWGQFCDNA